MSIQGAHGNTGSIFAMRGTFVQQSVTFLVASLLVCLSSIAHSYAQNAPAPFRIDLDPLKGTVSDSFALTITVNDADLSSITPPSFPETEEFAIRLERRGQQTNIINGKASHSLILSYRVYPSQSLEPGTYSLPDFSLQIQGTQYPVKGPQIEILAKAQTTSSANSSSVDFRQLVDMKKPYVGQQVTYRARLLVGPDFVQGELDDVDIPNTLREGLGSQKQRSRQLGNKRLTIVSEVFIPTEAGTLEIPERGLTAVLRDPNPRRRRRRAGSSIFNFDPFDSPLVQSNYRRHFVAEGIRLEVRPLPPAPEDVTGYIPVGSLHAETSVSKSSLTLGESATLTIELSGRANLRPYELPEPDNSVQGFRVYDDQAKLGTSVSSSKIFYRKTFSIALVPNTVGTLEVPRYSIHYFDPSKNRYQTITTEALTIEVTGDPSTVPTFSSKEAPDDTTESIPEEEEIVEGLRPQHTGPKLLTPYQVVPRNWFLALCIGVPLIALLIRVLLGVARLRADPEHRARKYCLANAQQALSQEGLSVDELWQICLRFFHLRLTHFSTASDAASIAASLQSAGVSTETTAAVHTALEEIEVLRFSGRDQQQVSQEQKNTFSSLLAAVDSEVQ